MRSLLILSMISLMALSQQAYGQAGHDIDFQIDGYENDTIVLSFYLGTNQYIRDTILRTDGVFQYAGPDTLPPGVYNALLQPTNYALQLLIDTDQHFTAKAKWDGGQLVDIGFNGSEDNALYYQYVSLVQHYKPEADSIKKWMAEQEEGAQGLDEAQARFDEIDNIIVGKSDQIQSEHPQSITTAVLRLNNRIDVPDYSDLSEEDAKQARFEYYRDAYVKQTQLTDDRLFRSPFIHGRVTNIINRLTVQHPDSVSASIDMIMSLIESTGNKDYFQFYLVDFINTFAKSRIVGFDAVYVHLAENYYGKGKAPWMDKKELAKLVGKARTMKATLVGKIAPNITLYDKLDTPVRIHDINAAYTILYFWSPTCGHCKKSTPKLIAIADSLEASDVQVVTVCNKTGKDAGTCWDYVDSRAGMDKLMNLYDPKYQSKFKTKYYINSTPKIFVLDREKKVISKGIGVDQLMEVMQRFIDMDAAAAESN